jgi:hypothetical protein
MDPSDAESPGATFIPVKYDVGCTHRKFRDHNSLPTTWVEIFDDADSPPYNNSAPKMKMPTFSKVIV